jgi:ribosomal protein S18 acetylase RimI-like enzyme
MNITIESATLSYAGSIGEAHIRSWQHSYKGIVPASHLDLMSIEQSEGLWRESIQKGFPQILMAMDAERVAGFIAFGKSRDKDATALCAEVQAIYLKPEYLGKGVGKTLWLAARDKIIAMSFKEVTLWVLMKNFTAIRFYRQAGFVSENDSLKNINIGGESLEEIRFRYHLVK